MKFFLTLLQHLLSMAPKKPPKEQEEAKILHFERKPEPIIIVDDAKHINTAGLKLLKDSEGLELKAYKDTVGILTIGYGHTGDDVTPGQVISEIEAEALLYKDLRVFEEGVSKAVKVPLTSNQFSSLVVFSYNVGLGNFKTSTLLKMLNAGDYSGAADQLLRWDRAGGKVLKGLTIRRNKERDLFNL